MPSIIGTGSLVNRGLRNDPSFRPGQSDYIISGVLGGVGKGIKSLKNLKNLRHPLSKAEKGIIHGTGSAFEGVSGIVTMFLLSQDDIQNLQSDASVFEKALQTEVDGMTLAVPAEFVTTEYYGKGERDGYYAPDTEFSGGVPDLIMLNPELLQRWIDRGDPLEEIIRNFRQILDDLR